MTQPIRSRHLLSIDDLEFDDVLTLFDTAAEMHDVQHRSVKKLPALRGRTVVNLFFEDSTRTRSSFEIAGKWLSADVINVSAKGSSVSKGESLRDTVLTVAAMGVDGLVIRHGASGAAKQVSQWTDAVVINAGDGMHEHPTQALLDAYTLQRRLGSLEDRHVAIVGDLTHSRVFRSNVLLLSKLGAHITVVAPPTLMPAGVTAWAKDAGFATSYDDMAFTPPLLGTITARTLIVHGDRDPLYPVDMAVQLFQSIPQSSLWVVPAAGHGPVFGPHAAGFSAAALAHLAG